MWTARWHYLLLINGSRMCALSLAQIDQHKVTSWYPVAYMGVTGRSLLKWSEKTSTRNEQSWNATRISSSGMIHTIVEGLLQQLSTAFVAAIGKKQWSTTSERDQTSCHNSMSASKLASCLSISRDVFTTRGNHSSFTDVYETPNICNCTEHSQNDKKYCCKLDAQPMGGLFTRLGASSQDVARPTSNSLPELPGTTTKASPERATGSPEESNTKTH